MNKSSLPMHKRSYYKLVNFYLPDADDEPTEAEGGWDGDGTRHLRRVTRLHNTGI